MKTVHRMNSERYVGDSKLHEMVAIAMEEDWEVCNAHIMLITQTMGSVIAQGVASGEFEVADLEQAALCCCTGMMRFFHPQMIAQCANKPGPTIDQMIDFIFASMAPRGKADVLGSIRRVGQGAHCAVPTNPALHARKEAGLLRRCAPRNDVDGCGSRTFPALQRKNNVDAKTPKDLHFYEPANGHGLKHDPFNAIIAPRPIGWISSRDAKGNVNLAPYSFFNAFNYHPPIIGFSSTSWKDSVQNIQETGEFVWNLATMDLAQQMNATAAHVAHDVSEFSVAGLTAVPGKLVNVPRVAESPVSFECKLSQIIQLQGADGNKAQAWLTLGEVVAVHIDKAFIKDGVYQTALARPIVRAGRQGDYFEIKPENMFEMKRPD